MEPARGETARGEHEGPRPVGTRAARGLRHDAPEPLAVVLSAGDRASDYDSGAFPP